MLKRASSGANGYKKRKRKKNGVSTSSSVLELLDNPPNKLRFMPVWHTNVEDPTSLRRSAVPIPSEPPIQEALETEQEDFVATVSVVSSAPGLSNREKRNNSVSCNPMQMTDRFQRISPLTFLNRQGRSHGFRFGQQSWMNSCVTTVFQNTCPRPNVPIVPMSWEFTGALIAPLQGYIVLPA